MRILCFSLSHNSLLNNSERLLPYLLVALLVTLVGSTLVLDLACSRFNSTRMFFTPFVSVKVLFSRNLQEKNGLVSVKLSILSQITAFSALKSLKSCHKFI